MKRNVLFFCTGNSCRSQMAESILRRLRGDAYHVYSAGTKPSSVNPKAVKVMAEIGIDISGHVSKSVDEFVNRDFDFVVTVCDKAKETCPAFGRAARRIHWSFIDPACATGNEEEILSVFRNVRDEIKRKIEKEFGK